MGLCETEGKQGEVVEVTSPAACPTQSVPLRASVSSAVDNRGCWGGWLLSSKDYSG